MVGNNDSQGSFTFETKWKTETLKTRGINTMVKSSWVYSPLCLRPPHHAGLGGGFTEDSSTRALGSHLWKMVQFNGNAITDVLRLKQPILSQTHLPHQVSGQVLIPNSC